MLLNGQRRVVDLPRAGRVTIGRARSDLCLADRSVSMDHATLLINVGVCRVIDRSSVSGTVVNDRPVKEAELVDGDVLALGVATLTIREVPEPGVEERTMLAAVHQGGDDARHVFADWLELQGRGDEAAWLRAEVRLHATPEDSREPCRVELERLTAHVGSTFRAQVARAGIEACFKAGCPRRWESLPLGNEERVRACGTCNAQVPFCDTVEEGQRRVSLGRRGEARLVVDPSRPRAPRDLWPMTVLG